MSLRPPDKDSSEPPATASMRWSEIVIGLGLGLVMLVAGLLWTSHQRQFLRNGQRVEGTIIGYIQDRPPVDPTDAAHYPVFQYRDHLGQQHTATSTVGFVSGVFLAPKPATVVYDPRDPGRASLASAHYLWLLPLGLSALGLLFTGCALRAVWRRIVRG